MKEFLKRVGKGILRFFVAMWIIWLAVIVGVIVGLITKNTNLGIVIGFGVVTTFAIFLWLRQVWWWITKTGDFKIPKENEGNDTEG